MFTIQLAGVNISVKSIFDETQNAFADFYINGNADYSIEITDERFKTEQVLLTSHYPLKRFSNCEIEVNALYRDLTKILIRENIILLHGVLVKKDNRGYIFTAPSGTGKSTHARLWEEAFGSGASIINGDKPLVRLMDGAVFAYGSPWKGKENIGTNERIKLCGICKLLRGRYNSIEKVDFDADSLIWLLEETQISGLESETIKRVRCLKDVAKHVPLYKLTCNMSHQAAIVACGGMNANT